MTSLQAQPVRTTTTTLITTSQSNQESWSKTVIAKAKSTNTKDKESLRQLNNDFVSYLEKVKVLEDQNLRLISEVDRSRATALPRIVNKIQFDKQLEIVRADLDNVTVDNYRCQLRYDDAEGTKKAYSERMKFLLHEAEVQKQKIFLLQSQLSEITSQKSFLVDGAKIAKEEIDRERQRQEASFVELDNLRKKLSSERLSNKKVEFEMQTLLEEIEFRKELFLEESNFLRNTNAIFLNANELASFYKNELYIAIKQIREDFQELSKQQLAEYKELKEQELAYVVRTTEKERLFVQQTRSRQDQSRDLDLQTSKELKSSYEYNASELNKLTSDHSRLLARVTDLENKLEGIRESYAYRLDKFLSEIRSIREMNAMYSSELDNWERITRIKLESEIQTYRSLLQSQLGRMPAGRPVPVEDPKQRTGKIVRTTIVKEEIVDDNGNVIDSKQQTFRNDRERAILLDQNNQKGRAEPAVFNEQTNGQGGRSQPQTQGGRPQPQPQVQPLPPTQPQVQPLPPTQPQPQPLPSNNFSSSRNITINKKTAVTVTRSVSSNSVEDHIKVLKEVFDYFDRDRNGRINSSELDRVLSRLSIKISKEAYEEILKEGDFDLSRDLDFNEFLKIMLPVFTGKFEDDELWYAFKKFDTDNSGKLTVSELKQILSKIGQHFTDNQLARLIATVDADFDGKLNFAEFARLMKSPSFTPISL